MRALLSKKGFNKALSLLSKVGKRSLVKLRTGEHSLILEATTGDGELYLKLPIRAEVKQHGETCVKASELLGAEVRSITAKYVELDATNDDKLIVKTGNVVQKLALKPTEVFPEFPEPQFQAVVPSLYLAQGIEKVGFAVEKSGVGPLSYLYIDGRGGHTRVVGSDGHRLSVFVFYHESDLNVKIHYKSLNLLKALLKNTKYNETVRIGFDGGGHVFITNGEWTLAIRDSESRYPAYDAIIQYDDVYDLSVGVSADDLNHVLENFKRFDKITIEFDYEGFKIKTQQGAEAFVKAEVLFGNVGFSLDFDTKQLHEFTRQLTGMGIMIYARFKNDYNVPAMFKVNDIYLYLVMPLIR